MFFQKIKVGLKTAVRILTMQDYWQHTNYLGKTKLLLVFALNILDTFVKFLGPLALAKSIENVVNPESKTMVGEYELTPESLLYLAALFNSIHFLIPDIKKLIIYSLQEKFSNKLSKQIVNRSQTLSIENSMVSLNELLQDSSKHLQCINFETDSLLNSITDNIHPLLLDIIFGISFTFSRFEKHVGLILLTYLLIAFLLNETLCHISGLSKRSQQASLEFSRYLRSFHETLINSETVHLFNRVQLEQYHLKNVYYRFALHNRTNYKFERLWILQSLLTSLIQFLATAYVVGDNFHKLELDDIIFLLNYVVNLGDVIQSINTSFRTAFTVIESIDEAHQFIHNFKEPSLSSANVPTREHNLEQLPLMRFNEVRTPGNCFDYPITINLPPDPGAAIEFFNVSYYYNSYEPILSSVCFKIPADGKFALVGSSNAGKTTIIKLLCGLIKPVNRDARIRVFGKDIEDIPIAQLRELVSVTRQQVELFEDESIKYNISYGFGDERSLLALKNFPSSNSHKPRPFVTSLTTEGKFYQATEDAQLQEFTRRKNCRGFSGGQRQRIGIARILMRNSSIFVCDEPTSQLDSETEQRVLTKLQQATKGKTLLMIAHRLSTIKDAKKIMVLGKRNNQHGSSIIEEGTHEELIANNQQYAQLWRLQTK